MVELTLPKADRSVERYRLQPPSDFPKTAKPAQSRTAFAAVHVVAEPFTDRKAGGPSASALDWDATMAYRLHLWRLGFKVAEAMDTSQRGMGLDWPTGLELIRRSIDTAKAIEGADLASGVGTDHLLLGEETTLDDVRAAYEQQIDAVEALGGKLIIMASRALVRAARSGDDFLAVYDGLLRQTREKVILHWLGPMFDPMLEGYWGSTDLDAATETFLQLIQMHADKIDGVKISLLDANREIELRSRLPAGVKVYTGDDFNYPALIAGDGACYSDALLGIFDAIAPAATAAFERLDQDDLAGFNEILAPTVPLSRKIFEAPTQFYKAGIVLLAWLNGHQDHFIMVDGMQAKRAGLHYADVFRLADQAGLLVEPDLAAKRMAGLMTLHGIS